MKPLAIITALTIALAQTPSWGRDRDSSMRWGTSLGLVGTLTGEEAAFGAVLEVPIMSTGSLVLFEGTPRSSTVRYLEDQAAGYRHYLRGLEGGPGIAPYVELGACTGQLINGDGTLAGGETRVYGGVGIRLRPFNAIEQYYSYLDAGSSWTNVVMDLNARYVSDVGPLYTLSLGVCTSDRASGRPGAAQRGGVWSTGPRLGCVVTTGETADALAQYYGVGPTMTLFGWQFEYEFSRYADGQVTLFEVIPIAAGLEHGFQDISCNFLFGVRRPSGLEFLVGPYISESNDGITIAAGKTFDLGRMQFPLDVGCTITNEGARYSLTCGWNL